MEHVIKDAEVGRFARARRRMKEFVVAGAIGISSLLSPSPASAQQVCDTLPQVSARQARPDAQQLRQAVTALSGNVQADTHPTNAQSADALSANFVQIYEIREIVLHPPAEGAAMRAVYDAAIGAWSNRDGAVRALDSMLVRAVQNLHAKMVRGDNPSLESGAALEPRLARIDRGIACGHGDYFDLEPDGGVDVAEILRVVRGGQLSASPRQTDPASGIDSLPLIGVLPFDFGSQFFLTGLGERQFVALSASSTPTLNSLFGGQDIAQGAMNALVNGYTVLADPSASFQAQQAAAGDLFNQLNRIPRDKEIWNASLHPHFAAAMNALQRGDLRTALSELSQETAFNSVYQNLGDIHQITVSQRAVARLVTSLWFRLPERENITEFEQYRRGSRILPYSWDVLHYDFGATYTNLLVAGRDQPYRIDPRTNSLAASGPARPVEGDGHAIDVGASVTWGGSMLQTPIEATLMGRLGWLWWNIETQAQVNGRSETLSAQSNSPYGMLNFDVAVLGYEGRDPSFRIPSRFGLGLFNLYPYVYMGMRQRWTEQNRMRIETHLTPRFMLFWGQRREIVDGALQDNVFFQPRVGADLRPVDFTIQQSRNHTWFFGPGLQYDWNLGPVVDGGSVGRTVHTLEPYVHFTYQYARGFSVDARVGYLMDVGGDEANHLPTWPGGPGALAGTLNIVLTPAYWGSPQSSVRAVAESARAQTPGVQLQGGVGGGSR
ncbi:MAG: hypothetical protein AB1324_05075 [Candidatus Micrarchaeota archaeon]